MTKQFLVITGLLLFSLTSFAQLSVTPYFQVDLGNFLEIPSTEGQLLGITHDIGGEFKINYTYGVDVTYDFNPKWSLKTGLMYQEMGNQTGQLHYFEDDVFKSLNREFSHQFVTIPLQAQYNFRADKRFSPYVAFGGALNINTYNSMKTSYFDENNNLTNTTDFELLDYTGGMPRKFNISAKADVGFNYKFTEKWSLNTFISTNALLNPAFGAGNDIIKSHHFNIGVGMGLKYSF